MEATEKALRAVQAAAMQLLREKLDVAMEAAHITIANQSLSAIDPSKSLFEQKLAIVKRFTDNMDRYFETLISGEEKKLNVLDYGSLSLVAENDLEALIAMEGMISHARNTDISEYLRFSTRLDTMFYGKTVDESNNPMDPEQIGEAFKNSISSLELPSKELLIAYRSFNTKVFHDLESILEVANKVLIEHGILPNLDLAARRRKEQKNKRSIARERSLPEERAFANASQDTVAVPTPQLFSMMQSLMHSQGQQLSSPTKSVPVQSSAPVGESVPSSQGAVPSLSGASQNLTMVGGKRIEMIEQETLMGLLRELQTALSTNLQNHENSESRESGFASLIDVNKSLGQLLEDENTEERVTALDANSADVINLITMLYEVIWQDETVPIPVKELIGRTQIAILTIALRDPSFFDLSSHPARQLLNELATAGISWTEFDKLEHDPIYTKMKEIVGALVNDSTLKIGFIEELLADFKSFKKQQAEAVLETENRLAVAGERQQRIEEIGAYAREKIVERILDNDIAREAVEFLQTDFHKFVVQVLLREGPGGVSWKPVMNTIDVLLWTVQTNRSDGDVERFVKVNPRLMTNLGKALSIAGYSEEDASNALASLKKVQEQSFKGLLAKRSAESAANEKLGSEKLVIPEAPPSLPDDDEHLLEVGKYEIGIWLEFKTHGDRTIRCTLAARIATIDKYVFINSQGVKVIEKTKIGLAKELKAGTVRVISEAPLMERAMETVIGRLRESDQSSSAA